MTKNKKICIGNGCSLDNDDIKNYTDKYFTKTRQIIEKYGDVKVKYAVFMRRPVIFAPKIAVSWLEEIAKARKIKIDINLLYKEGDWVGAGEPMITYEGAFSQLVELETLFLQKLGAPCVAAYNAFEMSCELPKTAFIAMDARHCAGVEMSEMMSYAASVGSNKAKAEYGAKGFVGNANDFSAHYFGAAQGLGTMPHALIGYATSTLKAAKMFYDTFPTENLVVLVDYFGKEITDSLQVCKHFKSLADEGKLALRIDTHGGRFIEGLDTENSYKILNRYAPDAIKKYRLESELRHLIGTGVTAAAVWHLRENLDRNGFDKVKIIVSSGFDTQKCKIMAIAHAPIDFIGTGSYLPKNWIETYATADIIEYNGKNAVKVGREFLIKINS